MLYETIAKFKIFSFEISESSIIRCLSAPGARVCQRKLPVLNRFCSRFRRNSKILHEKHNFRENNALGFNSPYSVRKLIIYIIFKGCALSHIKRIRQYPLVLRNIKVQRVECVMFYCVFKIE